MGILAPMKHVVVLVATTCAFGISLWMFHQLVGWASPWMVLMLFMCFLGLARIAEPVYMLKLPGAWEAIRAWEMKGAVYRALGVPGFGALLKNTPLRLLNTSVYVSKDRRDAGQICRQVASAEAIHFWAGLLLMPYLAVCFQSRRWSALASFLAVQILGNAYPIMHLRSVRGRLERIARRRPA